MFHCLLMTDKDYLKNLVCFFNGHFYWNHKKVRHLSLCFICFFFTEHFWFFLNLCFRCFRYVFSPLNRNFAGLFRKEIYSLLCQAKYQVKIRFFNRSMSVCDEKFLVRTHIFGLLGLRCFQKCSHFSLPSQRSRL